MGSSRYLPHILIKFALIAFVTAQCGRTKERNVCHQIIGEDPLSPPSECFIGKCSTETTVDVKDEKRGKVVFQLPILSQSCNVTRYEIALRVREDLSDADCSTAESEWRTHSKRTLHVISCSQNDTQCLSLSPKCSKFLNLDFGYVYSAWYQLKITPHLGTSTRQTQRSKPVKIITKYEKRLVNLNKTVSTLQYRDDSGQFSVSFLYGPDLDWDQSDDLQMTLRLVAGVDGQVENPCQTLGTEHTCCSFQGEGNEKTVVDCTSVAGAKPNCTAAGNSVQCRYQNVPPGSYCAILTFIDDRCEPYTVWTESESSSCRLLSYRVFNAEKRDAVEGAELATADASPVVIYAVLGAIIAVGLLVTVLFFAHRYHSKRRERIPTTSPTEVPMHRYDLEQRQRFNFSNQFTLTERPRPEVLLLYCRDSKPFVELVGTFKNVLNKICKCQVYDYYDEALWDHVCQDPEGWVRELIMEREAKVVIVMSRGAALTQKSDPIKYRNPHAFDHLFPYVLKLVRDHASDDTYRRHFVITFDGYTENNTLVDHLNPYTRFILPKHLNKLFEHLHDSKATVHFDTSRKLEEREEVRQLRLRLEHLINLSLLHKSENEQIYDW